MLVNDKGITTQNNLGGRSVQMTIDMSSLPMLMKILTDLYSDPAAAVIREYTTNALDSHLASGQSRPVEIGTPSRLSPYFTVQDFGVGMSEEDIVNIYSQFGNSTKRNNNIEAGMLGLGSKSALTYTEQFNLTGVKDGRKILVSVSRAQDGTGGMQIVSNAPTTEPNGVMIKVPVQRYMDEFNNKVHQFMRYVTPGAVIVNGQPVDSGLEFVTKQIAMVPKVHDRYATDRIVMGNVSYPTNTRLLNTHAVIYFAEMGSVDFPPSREELMFTDRTNQTIDKMKQQFNTYFEGHLDKMIQNCATIREAWDLQKKYREDFSDRALLFNYKGIALPEPSFYVKMAKWRNNIDSCKVYYDDTYINIIDDDTVIVTGWDNKRFSRVQARKLHGYFDQHLGVGTVNRAILMPQKPYPELFTNNRVFNWADIKKFGVVKRASQKRVARTWEGIGGAGSQRDFNWFVPDDKKEIYYASKTLLSGRSTYLNVISADSQFFWVTDSEKDRFLKLYPKAKFLGEYFKKLVSEYLTNLTLEDYEFYRYYEAGSRNDYLLDWNEVKDPELKKIVRFSHKRKSDPVVSRYLGAKAAYDNLSYTERRVFKFPDFASCDTSEQLMAKYPLLTTCNYYSYGTSNMSDVRSHLLDYVNYVYEKSLATKKEEPVSEPV